ncbi:acyl- n-acyltransferase [Fusarium albosuccineum]|uniref:Acyl- n-acyltransferase n=1 Tax=Fusarium albosuccineum TaxID=1237068 RepID=A0A8H4LLS7_9HYPO|nr:acyl- n-acyltransferase [Fusarium albosuccineum]
MEEQSKPEIRLHRKDNAEAFQRAHDIAVPAFRCDPLFAWIFVEGGDDDKRQQRLRVFLKPVVRSGPICGGYILDANDWSSMMVISEPGQDYDGLWTVLKCGAIPATLSGGLKPTHYLKSVDKVKLQVLPKSRIRDCFYILLAATTEDHRRQGLLSAQTQYLQDQARKVGRPVWLEATSRYSMSQFLRHGFELVEDIRVGKGKVNAEGKKEPGGDGVLIGCMIWWPEGVRETFEEKG